MFHFLKFFLKFFCVKEFLDHHTQHPLGELGSAARGGAAMSDAFQTIKTSLNIMPFELMQGGVKNAESRSKVIAAFKQAGFSTLKRDSEATEAVGTVLTGAVIESSFIGDKVAKTYFESVRAKTPEGRTFSFILGEDKTANVGDTVTVKVEADSKGTKRYRIQSVTAGEQSAPPVAESINFNV